MNKEAEAAEGAADCGVQQSLCKITLPAILPL